MSRFNHGLSPRSSHHWGYRTNSSVVKSMGNCDSLWSVTTESKPNPLRELFQNSEVRAFYSIITLDIKEKRSVSWLAVLNYHYFSFLITSGDQPASLTISLSLPLPTTEPLPTFLWNLGKNKVLRIKPWLVRWIIPPKSWMDKNKSNTWTIFVRKNEQKGFKVLPNKILRLL